MSLKFYKTKLASSEKLSYYRPKHLDRNYDMAPYLSIIKIHNFRQALTKIRISAHKLEIENVRLLQNKVAREQRICKLEVEDELHFLIACQKLSQRRCIFEQNIIHSIPEWKSFR